MIDIYEKSGDPSQRLLVRERQPLPDFADAAEWSHVGARDTVNQELGSILQNQGYAQVHGDAATPLEIDWEALFGGSAKAPEPDWKAGGASGQSASAAQDSGSTGSSGDSGRETATRTGSSEDGARATSPTNAGSQQGRTPVALADTVAGPVIARAGQAVRENAAPRLEALESYVRERPVQALAWTLGLGFLLGILP